MAADLSDLAQSGYWVRIDRVRDHIVQNLADPLPLDELAGVAGFSSFHFHRIFRALVGETPQEFTTRVRCERALFLMTHHRSLTLTEIAQRCGLGSSSQFSRTFRTRYGVSPRRLDLIRYRTDLREKLTQEPQSPQQLASRQASQRGSDNGLADEHAFEVRVVSQLARRVAYVRVRRPYEGGVPDAAGRLVAWAERRGLIGGRWLGYQWDDPEVVPLAKCTYDVALEIPRQTPDRTFARRNNEDPVVGSCVFAATTMAEIYIDGTIDAELQALTWLYARWLPSSGFVPDDQPCFEVWDGLPFADGLERFRLSVQLPIRRQTSAPPRPGR